MTYNIVFTIDKNYVQHLAVTLISLLENNQDVQFTFFVIHKNLPDNEFKTLETITQKYGCNLKSIVIDNKIFKDLVITYHFNEVVYYRLLIPELLDLEIDKVLYLDVDIVVNGDIRDLFSYDLGTYPLASVEAVGFNRHIELKMSHTSKYFCSGVMLLNLNIWRERKLSYKVVRFIEENPGIIKMMDQDGMNAVFDGYWLPLHPKYGQQTSFYQNEKKEVLKHFEEEDFLEAIKKPAIIHYTGSSKPWHFRNTHPYKYLYWKYLKMTPYKRYFAEDFTLLNLLKWMIPISIKKFIKSRITLV
ncbi:glycosyltransferase family 8 protein [Sulfurovum sp. zt1-1]|uniref:Glycosyltransferase family 8 protein n=1 Tax=Sulfurovum zhangzhouensis TaxID=3019067 RepID=A0ABT7R038_9BACT|nr:glycosyltransferase family 8 protein [Sulfurovum zhangzhouensis]MDM5272408.1 glycosyltransferase family 8 protein [Sulfurovum zhangzhouensis]